MYLYEVGEHNADHQEFVNDLEQVRTDEHTVLETAAEEVSVVHQHIVQV